MAVVANVQQSFAILAKVYAGSLPLPARLA
jgi:hypothetical protein